MSQEKGTLTTLYERKGRTLNGGDNNMDSLKKRSKANGTADKNFNIGVQV